MVQYGCKLIALRSVIEQCQQWTFCIIQEQFAQYLVVRYTRSVNPKYIPEYLQAVSG